ncbi:MAG: hypothetical protein SF028_00255 [Candidatus Sumerlaeia bacterium]|nr:hypothetical protein [Candidatus Sumerlaeia bacterium]
MDGHWALSGSAKSGEWSPRGIEKGRGYAELTLLMWLSLAYSFVRDLELGFPEKCGVMLRATAAVLRSYANEKRSPDR